MPGQTTWFVQWPPVRSVLCCVVCCAVLCPVLQRDDDYSKGRDFIPYRDVIMRACSWLVADAKPGDSLFFHYSGHGGSMKDPTCECTGGEYGFVWGGEAP